MSLEHHRGGAGEPLVLVHGIASHWGAWGRVLPALEARFEVLAIDLPGFGRSAPDGTAPTLEGQADRVERFFEEAGVERPHVAGFSMGGGIVLELARRGSVRTATALCPVGFWTDRERAYSQRSLRGAIAATGILRPVLPAVARTAAGRTSLLSQMYARPWRLTPEEVIATVEAARGAEQFEACLRAFAGHRFHDPDELRATPLTVAWGDKDRLLLYRQAARARRMLPWARHVTLRRCGHVPFADDPEQVAQVLIAGAAAAVAAGPTVAAGPATVA